ncbi:hypothetical protein [Microbacterium sp. No. 7]|uniref:hypothetical protein n=1 Tax=Microbacterium sp. No. 7 TaxID=1714373 RepID=UPI0006D1878E|nr:hypothetical protein [Microbacterium sp. No. 7]ALJ19517.1 hypothetical protein AOA12_06185 [Microbacterium sp. No. 7]
MTDRNLPNTDILAGYGTSKAARAYRALVDAYGHDGSCDAYALNRDSHWTDVVRQAYRHGDIDSEGNLT